MKKTFALFSALFLSLICALAPAQETTAPKPTARALFVPKVAEDSVRIPLKLNKKSGNYTVRIKKQFHTPTYEKQYATYHIDVPTTMAFSKVIIDVDFTVGPWNGFGRTRVKPGEDPMPKPAAGHNIIWLYRAGRYGSNTLANVNVFAPPKRTFRNNQNLDLPPTKVTNGQVEYPDWKEGETYHMTYTYDAVANKVTPELKDKEGKLLKSFSHEGTAANNVITIPKFGMDIQFGHKEGQEGPEIVAYGWKYSNLKIEFVPADK